MKTTFLKLSTWLCMLVLISFSCKEEANNPVKTDEPKDDQPVTEVPQQEVLERTIKVDTTQTEFSAWHMHYRIGRGINIGSTFDAPQEGAWSGQWEDHFPAEIKDRGFQSVRLPVRYDNKVGPAPDYKIDPQWMSRITYAIDLILKEGLVCILDFHHINSLDENPSQANQDMFVKVWEQLGDHYQDYPVNLIFELYNEPHGNMTDEILNDIYQRAYAEIRENNPQRVLVIGGNRWNNAYDLINDVWFPENDKYVMGTFHRYKPNDFTHQKEGDNVKFMGTEEDIAMAQDMMQDVSDWSDRTGIPVLLGEFGTVKWGGLDSRIRWTRAVVNGAKKYDFSMSYWNLNGGTPDGWNIYHNGIWQNEFVEVLME